MTEGPIMRPACHGIDPSAIALGRRSRSTSWGIIAIRLGSSNARKTLLAAASASRCSTRARPMTASPNAAVSASDVMICVTIKRRRRFTRSASTPPTSWKRSSGRPWASPRKPRNIGSRVTSHTSQANVTYSARCPST